MQRYFYLLKSELHFRKISSVAKYIYQRDKEFFIQMFSVLFYKYICVCVWNKEGETERDTDRETDTEKHTEIVEKADKMVGFHMDFSNILGIH